MRLRIRLFSCSELAASSADGQGGGADLVLWMMVSSRFCWASMNSCASTAWTPKVSSMVEVANKSDDSEVLLGSFVWSGCCVSFGCVLSICCWVFSVLGWLVSVCVRMGGKGVM